MTNSIERQHSWRQTITEWLQSGLSQKAFCNQHQINMSNFQYWRRRLHEIDNPTSDVSGVLARIDPICMISEVRFQTSGITMPLCEGRGSLMISGELDIHTLTNILRLIQSGEHRVQA